MNAKQTIKKLKELRLHCQEYATDRERDGEFNTVWHEDVEALGKAIEVLEKEIPKKVENIHKRSVWNCGYCSCCKNTVYGNYCPHCGHKLDWEE